MGKGRTAAVAFFVFDILWRGQDDLCAFALTDRKDILAEGIGPIRPQCIIGTRLYGSPGDVEEALQRRPRGGFH